MTSDAISLRCGFDGNESDEVMALHRTHAEFGVRFTFAVNTYYPEVLGGYFENRALYELIEASLRGVGLSPVLMDHYAPMTEYVVPVQGIGQLNVDENYALVQDEGSQGGVLLVWRFHAGGGGSYYSDNVIFDFVLPQQMMHSVGDDVERRCSQAHVRFMRYPSLESP